MVGLIVLAWPEEDNLMMVQFSKSHGPSRLDLVGIAIILLGYFPLIVPVFTRFAKVQQVLGIGIARTLVAVALTCGVLIAVGLEIGSELLLWTAVAGATVSQGVLVHCAFRRIT